MHKGTLHKIKLCQTKKGSGSSRKNIIIKIAAINRYQ